MTTLISDKFLLTFAAAPGGKLTRITYVPLKRTKKTGWPRSTQIEKSKAKALYEHFAALA